jgi:HEAT repeat protein
MKRLLLASCILLLAGCTPEPERHGRPLSYWRRELQSKDVTDRWRAASVIVEMGPEARQALPELVNCLHDKEYRVRLMAVRALANLGPDAREVVPDLNELLKDEEPGVRDIAAQALKQIDPNGTHAGVR